jgi:hypothetical protein
MNPAIEKKMRNSGADFKAGDSSSDNLRANRSIRHSAVGNGGEEGDEGNELIAFNKFKK